MKNPNSMTEAEQIEFVKENWLYVRFIKNPSEAVQMAAVREEVCAICYINNPSIKVIRELIKMGSAVAVVFLDELTDEEKFELIQLNPEVIVFLDNPTQEMINYSKLVY